MLWGFFNLAVGYMLVCRVGHFDLRSTSNVAALGVGALLISLFTARHFGQFHGGNTPENVRILRHGRLPLAEQLQLSGVGSGALVSNIGTWMQRIAQDWLVLTQLTHHNASAVGMVMAPAVRARSCCCCRGPASRPTASTSANS